MDIFKINFFEKLILFEVDFSLESQPQDPEFRNNQKLIVFMQFKLHKNYHKGGHQRNYHEIALT